MAQLDRRSFLALSASAAAAAAVAACSSDSKPSARDSTPAGRRSAPQTLGNPKDAPFEHVVLLMMENRSFDHLLGWMPGVNGKQAGLMFPDGKGLMVPTAALRTNTQQCDLEDPDHTWQAVARQYNDGRCDGWLATQ